MKLSIAIKLGAMLKPQGFGSGMTVLSTCALGAASEALSLSSDFTGLTDYGGLERMYPFLKSNVSCPGCASTRRVLEVIFHLNDQHRWTREAIADWVATIEPPEPEQAAEGLRITDELFDVRGAEALSADLGVLLLEAK